MMPTCEEMLAGSRAAHAKDLRDCRDSMARMLEIIDELKATLDETLAGWNEGIDTLNQVVDHHKELAMKLAKARAWIEESGTDMAAYMDTNTYDERNRMQEDVKRIIAELDADTKGDA